MTHDLKKLQRAARFLQKRLTVFPKIGLVLGSGLSDALVGVLQREQRFPWGKIPNFPQPTVVGHAGEWVFGILEEKPVLISRGRVHFYEGYSMGEIAFPIRLMKLVGIERLILTNA
ncbi:MAG: purine-nucleoside phosphorylase, partial [Candidatus Bipolaricaulia bacterium]